MAVYWQALIANLAVVALFITTWVHGHFIFANWQRWQRHLVFGATMGMGAVASMVLAIPIGESLFDLRSSLLAMAGFFGGPIAGAVAAAIAMAYRVGIVGGPNGITAITGIAAMAVAGWAVSAVTRNRAKALWSLAMLAVAVGGLNVGIAIALRGAASLTQLSFQVAAMNALATLLSGFFIMRYRVVERERDLLRQAFLNSPDFQYVKGPDSRFVSVNRNAARHNGFPSPEAMVGKTDFDLTDPARARRLIEAEQKVMAGGPPIVDYEEQVTLPSGEKIWYLTSKVALHDEAGRVIGLAGVSRDVTIRRRLRDEAEVASRRLDFVLANMSDGIALFDRFGILVYCNEQYRSMFALTREVREPGRHINEILRAVAKAGEQVGIPEGAEEEWVEQVAATLGVVGDQEIPALERDLAADQDEADDRRSVTHRAVRHHQPQGGGNGAQGDDRATAPAGLDGRPDRAAEPPGFRPGARDRDAADVTRPKAPQPVADRCRQVQIVQRPLRPPGRRRSAQDRRQVPAEGGAAAG